MPRDVKQVMFEAKAVKAVRAKTAAPRLRGWAHSVAVLKSPTQRFCTKPLECFCCHVRSTSQIREPKNLGTL